MNLENTENSKHTILIVDDEISNLKLLRRTFHKDFNILQADSAFNALDVLKSTSDEIAVIITDQRMPGMTGTELLAMSIVTHPYTVKILLTGYTDIEALVDGINKCELFQYVNKPYEPKNLKELVEKALEKYLIDKKKNYFYFKNINN